MTKRKILVTGVTGKQGGSVAQALLKEGHFVFSSVGDADRNTGIPHFDSKYKVEKHLESMDMPFSIVAPSYFMDNLFFPFVMNGSSVRDTPPG